VFWQLAGRAAAGGKDFQHMSEWYTLPGFHQPISSLSHLVGALIFAVLSVFLLKPLWKDWSRLSFMAVFAFSTVLLLTMSGVYHMLEPGGTAKFVMLQMDVSAIYLLIAGSFTFLHGCLFEGWKRWGMLVPIWTIACLGILTTAFFQEHMNPTVTMMAFLTMGWLGLGSGGLLLRTYGRRTVDPIFLGGVIYTVGALSNCFHWPIIIPRVFGPHELMHLCVLVAVGCYWWLAFQMSRGIIQPKAELVTADVTR
jgi:channel protein (hemolysin III family)